MNLKERVASIERDSLSERVYMRIKSAIIDGKFAPGERLSPEELAKHFAVSITPVRDALKQLESDALVEVVPRQGVFVSRHSADAINELFDIRNLIERSCVERLVDVPEETFQQMQEIVQKMEMLREGGKFREYSQFSALDAEFHAHIVKMRTNKRLMELYEELQWPIQVVRGLAHANYHRAEETVAEHMGIVDALLRRDVAMAQQKITGHLERARNDLLRHIASNAKGE